MITGLYLGPRSDEVLKISYKDNVVIASIVAEEECVH